MKKNGRNSEIKEGIRCNVFYICYWNLRKTFLVNLSKTGRGS